MPYQRRGSHNSGSGAVLLIPFLLLAIVPIVAYNGWVLSVLWNWFVPNIFTSAPHLSIGEAIGLALVVAAFLNIQSNDEKQEYDSLGQKTLVILATPILRGLLFLAAGLIVHAIVF